MGSLLRLSTGDQVFLKAARTLDEPESADLHRAEARITVRLPRPSPAPTSCGVMGTATGSCSPTRRSTGIPAGPVGPRRARPRPQHPRRPVPHPRSPRDPAAPAGPELASSAIGWGQLQREPYAHLEHVAPWAARHLGALAELELGVLVACEGESIVHGDMRADNLVVTPTRSTSSTGPTRCAGQPGWTWPTCSPASGPRGRGSVRSGRGPRPDGRAATCRPLGGLRAGGRVAHRRLRRPSLGVDVHPADLRSIVGGLAGSSMDVARRPAPRSRPGQAEQALGWSLAGLAWLEHLGL
ncbi:hypothetical protein NKG05_22140 [Oerskovia sp. M15]